MRALRAWQRAFILLPLIMLGAGCASRIGPGEVQPGVEQEVLAATAARGTWFAAFDWRLRDGRSTFEGSGATRLSPERARLDLFGPQDVAYLTALLEGDELRLPAGVPADLVPPAPLLWAALGVVRPPPTANLEGAAREGDHGAVLVYRDRSAGAAGYWTFRTRAGRLRSAEWVGNDGARRIVRLEEAGAGMPARATYSHERAMRELLLVRTLQEEVDDFPSDVWRLDAGF